MEEAFSSEIACSELSHANEDKENEYLAPSMEDPLLILVPAPQCQGSLSMNCCALEEIVEEPREPIVEDLDILLREADEGRARELQESSCSVVHQSWL